MFHSLRSFPLNSFIIVMYDLQPIHNGQIALLMFSMYDDCSFRLLGGV